MAIKNIEYNPHQHVSDWFESHRIFNNVILNEERKHSCCKKKKVLRAKSQKHKPVPAIDREISSRVGEKY